MPDSESDPTSRLEAALELLGDVLRLPEGSMTDVSGRSTKEIGSIKHIYSHINAMFYCRVIDLPGDKIPRIQSEWKARAKWVDEAEVDNANISTGHGKVWALVNSNEKDAGSKNGKGGAPGRKEKMAKKKQEEKGQMKLSFTKKSSVLVQEGGEDGRTVKSTTTSVNAEVHDGLITASSLSTAATWTSSPRKKRRIDISSDEEEG